MRNEIFEAAGLKVFERGWLSSNNVLFDGRGICESVLIDSGYCTHAQQTVALVSGVLGHRGLDRVVNTHLHSDHCGGNKALQQAFGCLVEVPAGQVEMVDQWNEALLTFRDTGQQCPQFHRTGSICAGGEIECAGRPWRAISSPGHDPESIVLHEPELKILISADALWENGFGVVFPELEGLHAFDDVRRTLNRLAELEVDWIIPGHGEPFRGLLPAIERAYARLDAFVADPARHSRHAAKVLIKFHLLEVRRAVLPQLLTWLECTRFIRLSHATHFGSTALRIWCLKLLEELATSGALRVEGEWIFNA